MVGQRSKASQLLSSKVALLPKNFGRKNLMTNGIKINDNNNNTNNKNGKLFFVPIKKDCQ